MLLDTAGADLIPDFDEHGNLPRGIHQASLEEVVVRFGHGSEEREACGQSLRWLVPMCRNAEIVRLIINGSFVTAQAEPQDVDCILVPGKALDIESEAVLALRIGLPYLSIDFVESEEDLAYYVDEFFATDRAGHAKGLVEVTL